jgi:hypothetical protein
MTENSPNGASPARSSGESSRDELSNLRDETARIVGTAIQNVIAESRSCVSYTPDEHVRLAVGRIQALYVGLGRGLGADYPEIPDSSSGADIAAAGPAACAASETARKSEEAWSWLTSRENLSISHHGPVYGDDDEPEEWRVHRESGGINDREWDVVGAGKTALDAVLAARAALNPDRVMKSEGGAS